ncbi:FkbM family methyltransferase [Salinibacter ruber]|uniref:FkbM family methyltransferase n=1 Tax=Salinibacter ruber TaxID=146919 RepID=UPI002167D5FE
MQYVESTRLLVETGMTGATGNIYFGLHEYESMGFTLHALRPNHNFIDVGANIGSYTLLSAGVIGAKCLAIEPTPSNFEHLRDNIRLNDISDRVSLYNAGAGSESDTLHFKASGTTVDRVLEDSEDRKKEDTLKVSVYPLDDLFSNQDSTVIVKIDVEGWESEVLDGAQRILQREKPTALIVELDGAGEKYGFDDSERHFELIERGFDPVTYDPSSRIIHPIEEWTPSGNTIYVNNIDEFTNLTNKSEKYSILDKQL